jgi:hypothetical protein
MTMVDLIIALFYEVNEQMHGMPKHPCRLGRTP